jgi:hypothetical protein
MQDSARIKRLIGKALIEENSYSIVKINNAAYMPFKLALRGLQIKPCSSLHLLLRTLHGCSLLENAGAYSPE